MGLFIILTFVFVLVSVAMALIILVQRPQGGGLASAFGGAGGGGTETVFGGRVGDALTWATVIAFAVYLLLAIGLNRYDPSEGPAVTETDATLTDLPVDPGTAPAFPDDPDSE
jgi:preprotein translocase subunit SecG